MSKLAAESDPLAPTIGTVSSYTTNVAALKVAGAK